MKTLFRLIVLSSACVIWASPDARTTTSDPSYKVVINVTTTWTAGKITSVKVDGPSPKDLYQPGDTIEVNLYEAFEKTPKPPYPEIALYEFAFDRTDLNANKFGIRVDPVFNADKARLKREYVGTRIFYLKKSGQKYSLKIFRFNSLEEKLRTKDGFTIFQGDFATYQKYHVGLNAGVFFPLGSGTHTYWMYPKDPLDPSDNPVYTIGRRENYQIKGVIFASIFPWGFEPEAPLSLNNFHFNLGTEISSTIFKSLYFGLGYDFKFFSIDAFLGILRVNDLAPGYSIGQDISNKKVSALPLVEKGATQLGIVVSFPINLASIFGKMIGI